jgi:shikimate kinase
VPGNAHMLNAPQSKSIFLVGPMGVGKTTVGRMLARDLNLRFRDSDHEIEKRTGADIPWIFDVEGEQGFREREAKVIDDLTLAPDVLLATGGGAVLRDENRRCLSRRGTVVYLDTSVELQLKRTSRDKKRPLLQGGDQEQILRELRRVREPIYQSVADLKVIVGSGSSRKVAAEILRKLRENEYFEVCT